MSSPTYDCQTCGACCSATDLHREGGNTHWVVVADGEPLLSVARLVRRFVDRSPNGPAHMKLDDEYTCTALRGTIGRSVTCAIYDQRPSPCRTFQAGAPWCLELRRERGVDTE